MHELFTQVLSNKDLSKAGDLFSVADREIVNDLTEVVDIIAEITSLPDYVNNDNDQSVVEICITRVTSAIRETGSIEQHAEALVALLESCLNHSLKPSSRDEDPPHAKISSDIISCIFLNYSKKDVMRRALPVAVKFLHKGNKELSRNMASYLSLAAIENADLLSKHIQPIIDSIISGNYSLCRVLPQIYAVYKEPLHDHVMALVSLLHHCENTEKLALLNLFALIAKNKPTLLEPSLPQLCEYLSPAATVSATMAVFLNMAERRPQLLVDHIPEIKKAVERHPSTLCLAAQVISSVGKLNKERAQEALNFVLEHLSKADHGSQSTLLREATLLCSSYPILFTDKMLQEVRQCGQIRSQTNSSNSQVNQISSGITIVKVEGSGNEGNGSNARSNSGTNTGTNSGINSGVTTNGTTSSNNAGIHGNSNVSSSTGCTSSGSNTINGPGVNSASGNTSSGHDTALEREFKNSARTGSSGSNGGIRGAGGSRPELLAGSHVGQYNNRYSHIEGSSALSRQENNRIMVSRPRLGGDSRSTGRLHISAAHRSMTRLNVGGGAGGGGGGSRAGSVGGLHKSMTRLSSSQQINLVPTASSGSALPPVVNGLGVGVPNNRSVTAINGNQRAGMYGIFSGGVTVTTAQDGGGGRGSIGGSSSVLRDDRELVSISTSFPLNGPPVTVHSTRDSAGGSIGSRLHHPHHASSQSFGQQTLSRPPSAQNAPHYIVVGSQQQQQQQQSQHQQQQQSASQTLPTPPSLSSLPTSATSSSLTQQASSHNQNSLPPQPHTSPPLQAPSTVVTPRRPNTSVTIISNAAIVAASQRISVFEPYPMRDTVQHFCEKHLDKIKSYMENVSVRIPPPAKCTIEERRAKKLAKLHFACQGRGEHCLYNRTFFTMKTRNPRIWIHLMFLALQARSPSALSSRDLSVSSLKNCWDTLKCENKTFLTVVTSAFPCAKDQETLLNELRHSGFFDVLEYVGSSDGPQWGCFLCNHPERAVGFLQDSQPVIEGQLKEKKGRWKLFRRWRTRYFTLSPAHLSCKGSKDDKDVTPIEVNQIRSVKVSRGARNIPKAFEIFTGDQSLILKPKDGKNAEEWVQCLSVALAHSHAQNTPANKIHSLPASLRTPV